MADVQKTSSSRSVSSSTKTKGPGVVAKGYLLLYNVLLCLGWGYTLLQTLTHVTEGKDHKWLTYPTLYSHVKPYLLVSQSAAILEVVHVAIGIVPSSLILTFFQVASRQLVLWGVVHGVPVVHIEPGLPMILIAWSITEVIRYAFYALSLLGSVPHFLIWCRYTFFFILYPLGVCGELNLIFTALPIVRASGMYSLRMPNEYNWSFDYYYFLVLIVIMYIPIFPQLYGHMISQRKKNLGGTVKMKTE